MPLYADTLALMCFEFHGGLNHIRFAGESLVVIIEDPKLGRAIVGTCRQQTVLKR